LLTTIDTSGRGTPARIVTRRDPATVAEAGRPACSSQNVFDVHPVRCGVAVDKLPFSKMHGTPASPMSRNKIALVAGVAALALVGVAAAARASRWQRCPRALETWRRSSIGKADPPFSHLGASQVGYGPSMLKQFTSARRFGSFQVVVESSGAVAFAGGPPARVVHTELLGDVGTSSLGDFTALAAPGR